MKFQARDDPTGRGPGTAGQSGKEGSSPSLSLGVSGHQLVLGSAGSGDERWVGCQGAAAASSGVGKEESSAGRVCTGLLPRSSGHPESPAKRTHVWNSPGAHRLNPVGILTHLILTTNPENGYHYCPYITDEKTKA